MFRQFRAFSRGFLFIGILELMLRVFTQPRLDPMVIIEGYPGTHAQRMEMALQEIAKKGAPRE